MEESEAYRGISCSEEMRNIKACPPKFYENNWVSAKALNNLWIFIKNYSHWFFMKVFKHSEEKKKYYEAIMRPGIR